MRHGVGGGGYRRHGSGDTPGRQWRRWKMTLKRGAILEILHHHEGGAVWLPVIRYAK